MICARCDKPIKGTPATYDHISSSGGGITVYLHQHLCRPTPVQTAPTPPVFLTGPRHRPARRSRR